MSSIVYWIDKTIGYIKRLFNILISRIPFRHRKFIFMTTTVFCISLISIGAIFFAYNKIIDRSYMLSDNMQHVIGIPDPSLYKNISFDHSKNSYFLGQSSIGKKDNSAFSKNSVTAGNPNKQTLYSLQLNTNLSKGITTYDNSSNLSFSMIPEYSTMPGRVEKGRIIYPIGLNGPKAIYSVMANGLQEDIAYNNANSNSETLKYKLKMPETLQARDMKDGNIGIYSADPSLFGNISFSTPEDQQNVMKARINSPKNSLVFVIPSPIIHSLDKSSGNKSKVAMSLRGGELLIKAENLKSIKGSFSIDPSVIVASANSFINNGNNDGSVAIDAVNNQVSEGGANSGNVGDWTSNPVQTVLPSTLYGHSTIAYDGFVYVMGGSGDGVNAGNNIVLYNSISNLTIGASWTKTNSLPTTIMEGQAFVYNGMIFSVGGDNGSTTPNEGVYYASICTGSNKTTQFATNCKIGSTAGTISSWNTGTPLPQNPSGPPPIAEYNGIIYQIAGEYTCSGSIGGYSSKINADGSNGAWNTLPALPSNAQGPFGEATAYNNIVYIAGGGCLAYSNTVYYSHINPDGTLGQWIKTSSMQAGLNTFGFFAYKGYLYTIGGNSGASSYTGNTESAYIRSDGSLGEFIYSTALPHSIGDGQNTAVYNGVIIVTGGDNNTNSFNNVYTSFLLSGNRFNTASFVKVATPVMTASRSEMSSAAANGYIYMVGGFDNNATAAADCNINKICNGVFYATVTSTGISAWTQVGVLPSTIGPRRGLELMVNQNNLYIMGGITDSSDTNYATNCSSFTGVYYACKDVWSSYILGTNFAGCYTSSTSCITAFNSQPSLPNVVVFGGYGIQNGYIYSYGGCSTGTIDTNGALKCTSTTSSVYYATSAAGSVGSWNSTSALPTSISNFAFTIYANTIYVIGGENSSSVAQQTEYYAALCSGTNTTTIYTTNCISSSTPGTISSWNSTTYGSWFDYFWHMPARFNASLVVFGGDLFLMGGSDSYGTTTASGDCNTLGQCSSVWDTPIGADGSIQGLWYGDRTFISTQPARSSSAVVEYGGYAYMFGGYNNSTTAANDCNALSQCGSYAFLIPFESGGYPSIRTWVQSTASYSNLITGTSNAGTVTYNGYIYEIGGAVNGGSTANVYFAAQCNGSNITTIFSTNCSGASTAGSISSWKSASSLTSAIQGGKAVVYNGYIYLVGGTSNGSTPVSTVEIAKINSDGSLGSWSNSTNSLTTARYNLTAVQSNGYIYAIGGYNGGTLSSVEYSKINSNGTIGAWTTLSSISNGALPKATQNAASVVYNGYIYEIAGVNSGGNTSNVYYSKINTDGTISAWAQTTSISSQVTRQLVGAYAVNGYLYVFGGLYANSTGSLDCAYGAAGQVKACSGNSFAPIMSGGSLGNWEATTSFPTAGPVMAARYNFSVAYSSGYIYIIGGNDENSVASNDCQATGFCSGVFYNEINTIPKIGNYSQLVDLSSAYGVDPTPYAITVNGGTCFSNNSCGTSATNGLPNPGLGGLSGSGGTTIRYSTASSSCTSFGTPSVIGYINNIWGGYYNLSLNSTGCSLNNTTGPGRYVELQYIMDDSYSTVFGSSCTLVACAANNTDFIQEYSANGNVGYYALLLGNVTSLNNYSLFYHAGNNSRLRNGATFNNSSSSQQTLDTPR